MHALPFALMRHLSVDGPFPGAFYAGRHLEVNTLHINRTYFIIHRLTPATALL